MTSPHMRVGLSPLAPGIYIGRLDDREGNRCTIKFSK